MKFLLQKLTLVAFVLLATESNGTAKPPDFELQIAPILIRSCIRCHNTDSPKGKLDLSSANGLSEGGENGQAVVPGKLNESLLFDYISGSDPEMPKDAKPLSKIEIRLIKDWISLGAKWPNNVKLKIDLKNWWSLKPLKQPHIPVVSGPQSKLPAHPIDAFIARKLIELKLTPSKEADRRTLIRRLTFDLHGLPTTPAELAAFVNDTEPKAYERLVDRLLASPRYGERWARHWLDVVHYGDTHGFDKDKRRVHAWPYRDYVIRSLNSDKPYRQFVMEQLAGDVLFSNDPTGVVATGFIAAGPWDFVGQVELREGTVDKKITRNLDRDDMVTNTMATFTSLTIGCARCHDHKFDPISQADYYSLQAVFAGVDRANISYDADPTVSMKRIALTKNLERLSKQKSQFHLRLSKLAGPELGEIEKRLAKFEKQSATPKQPEFGYHSQIDKKQNTTKWVQVDLGKPVEISHLVYVGCHDNFNNIGAGFGFPVHFKIEVSNDANFSQQVQTVVDQTGFDFPNPGISPQSKKLEGAKARFVRFTATKLAPRQNDFIFALAELMVLDATGKNVAINAKVTSLDSIEAPARWQKSNLVDGIHFGGSREANLPEILSLNEKKQAILNQVLTEKLNEELNQLDDSIKQTKTQLAAVPKQQQVYAAASAFKQQGNFSPTQGKPRPVYLLNRGSIKSPGPEMRPGTVGCIDQLPSRFELNNSQNEGQRRIALAEWITDDRNPLTWRSIVNRVWHYHFDRGIVDSPNDFGHMGSEPTHPELLDWLAVQFRDSGQSLKWLHRFIVTSAVYRQSSAHHTQNAKIDSGNQYLWRMNRRRLEAEELRDAVLTVSGNMDLTMYGPGFDLFDFKDDHSPHYDYEKYDPSNTKTMRRTIYRFIVRSVPDPFMETLDCADPSQIVPVRIATTTALQALSLMNNKFMIYQSQQFANHLQKQTPDSSQIITLAYQRSFCRKPTADELLLLTKYTNKHGVANLCRLLLNSNEFLFVD